MVEPNDARVKAAENSATPRLALAHVSKRFLDVQANDDISLEVMPGEIHAVLGENGAGKSTLMKIIYGAVRPDAGRLLWDGAPLEVANPRQARARGIAMVFQHFALFESLTVAENVWLGLEPGLPRAALEREVRRMADAYALELAPERMVSGLSVGERQRVEILRALLAKPRLLILDEPTSVLTPQAVEQLFVTLRKLAASGCSILYISHKLDEVRALCSRCTVLRAGRVTGVVDPRRETNRSLAELMLGAAPATVDAGRGTSTDASGADTREVALEVSGVSMPPAEAFGVPLVDVALSLRAGELLGVAGISGNGQAELFAALSGEDRRPLEAGSIRLFGREIAGSSPGTRRKLGLATVPEERIGRGSVPSFSLAENTLLTRREAVSRTGWLRPSRARALAAHLIARFGVRAPGPEAAAGSLSGGNLQKFIVGREVDASPRVLVVAQPTWGLDVGAAAQIRRALVAMAEAGAAVLVISEELEELFEICHEVVVLARGRLSPRVRVADASPELIGQWMAGRFEAGAAGASAHAADPAAILRSQEVSAHA